LSGAPLRRTKRGCSRAGVETPVCDGDALEEVGVKVGEGAGGDRHGAAFAALGAGGNAQQRVVIVPVNVGDREPGELADSRPAMGQQVDDGDVSRRPGRAY
jgi:hypothetical protein